MQSSLVADDDDVDLVDSVAGLRQILTNIAASADDDDNDVGGRNNHTHTLDQSSIIAASGTNDSETGKKSDEKWENTSETEIKCTRSDGMMMDEAVKYSQVEDEKTSDEKRCTLENETESTDADAVTVHETTEHSEMSENNAEAESELASEREIKCTDRYAAAADDADEEREEEEEDEEDEDGREYHSCSPAKLCTDDDDVEQVRVNLCVFVQMSHFMTYLYTTVILTGPVFCLSRCRAPALYALVLSICLSVSVCPSVCLSVTKMCTQKSVFSKTKQFRAMVSIDDP